MLHILNKILKHKNKFDIVVLVDTSNTYIQDSNCIYTNRCDNIDQDDNIKKFIDDTTTNITKNVIYNHKLHNIKSEIDTDTIVTSLSVDEISHKALSIIIQGNGTDACNFVNDNKEYRVFEHITDYELDIYYDQYKDKIPNNTNKYDNAIENETKKFINGLNLTNYSTSFNIIETLKKINKK